MLNGDKSDQRETDADWEEYEVTGPDELDDDFWDDAPEDDDSGEDEEEEEYRLSDALLDLTTLWSLLSDL